jgi:hypothetical protein
MAASAAVSDRPVIGNSAQELIVPDERWCWPVVAAQRADRDHCRDGPAGQAAGVNQHRLGIEHARGDGVVHGVQQRSGGEGPAPTRRIWQLPGKRSRLGLTEGALLGERFHASSGR